VYKPNLVLTTNLIVQVLRLTLEDVVRSKTDVEKFNCTVFGAYMALSYVISLCGGGWVYAGFDPN